MEQEKEYNEFIALVFGLKTNSFIERCIAP